MKSRNLVGWASGIVCLVALASAFSVPRVQAQIAAGPVVVVSSVSINPQSPQVGSDYQVYATIYSRHHRSLVVRARVGLPAGDIARVGAQDFVIQPGGSVTVSWPVYCGVDGGLVQVAADILREQ